MMRNKKIIMCIMVIVFALVILMCFNSTCYAKGDPLSNPNYYNPASAGMGSDGKFIEKANIVLNIIQIVGTIISVVTLMIIGIRYMFGSTEEKASYKETMVPWIIGAIMLFAIPNFLAVILDLVQSIKF